MKFERFLHGLGVTPKDITLYQRAFRHVSIPHQQVESYENLEFLGDAVIGFCVAGFLVKTLPGGSVGLLTRLRSHAVNQASLSSLARCLGFEEFIEIESSRIRTETGVEDSILADCFESVVGAIFLDQGIRSAQKFAMTHLKPILVEASGLGEPVDHKSMLQETLQRQFKQIPKYQKVRAVGPDHAITFTVDCIFQNKVLASGKGTSIKKAEQDAAEKALKKIEKKQG